MSFRLYVGNYPCNFTRTDVEDLFRDFDGVTIEKIHRKELKCFSFLVCKDIDQLVSVIQKMNNASVSGRQLRVRASDESLQEYVNLLLQETKDDKDSNSETPSLVPVQVMRNKYASREKYENSSDEKVNNEKFEKSSCYSSRSSQNNYQQKYEKNSGESFENYSCFTPRASQNSYQQKYEKNNDRSFKNNSCYTPRSSQKSYQQKYEKNNGESLENNACYSPRASQNNYQQKYEKDYGESFERGSHFSSRLSQDSYHQKYEKATGESFENDSYSPQKNYQQRYENGRQFEKSAYYSPKPSQNNYHKKYEKSDDQFEKNSQYSLSPSQYSYQQRSEKFSGGHFQESSCYSHSSSRHSYVDEYNSSREMRSPRNNYAKNLHEQCDQKVFTWVSVTNFPIGTSMRTIYELFSDYDPIKVQMICNTPRRDKTLTEAHVCFWNRDIANDVILNFDNTMFSGRVILVNDIEDLTIMNELLGVVQS